MSETAEPSSAAPYQSLYRRYRPQRFSEIRGQDHVALALRNAVRDGRIAHAYLFSGPRGTGKTSTARILGKALNCTALIEGEPCGICESCLAIAAGSSFDVHELDAASNNGVDAMRDLVARASLATPGSWKVYIVDEVHMLSTAASNAVLKTLEEPPDHVVFVLATTDPQKVLATIRSRTQHYEFHLLPDEVLTGLVDDVASAAGLALPSGASMQAVRRAKGSARDALSVLDQVVAAGVVDDDSDELIAAIRAVGADDGGAALLALDGAVRAGRDPQQLAVEIVEYLRAGFLSLAGASAVAEGLVRLSTEELNAVRALGIARCVRTMELVGAAIIDMHEAPEPRITLEVALFKAAALDAASSPEALLERIERLEHRLETLGSGAVAAAPAPAMPAPQLPADPGAPTVAPPAAASGRPALGAYRRPEPPGSNPAPAAAQPTPAPNGAPSPSPAAASTAEPVATTSTPSPQEETAPAAGQPAGEVSREELVTAWGDAVLTALRPKARALYQAGRFVASNDGTARFALPNDVHVKMASDHRQDVESALSAHLGRQVRLLLVVDEPAGSPPESPAPEAAGRAPASSAAATAPGSSTATPATTDTGREQDGSEQAVPDDAPSSVANVAEEVSDAPSPASPQAAVTRPEPNAPPTAASRPPSEVVDDFDDIGTPIEAGDPAVPTGLAWAEDRLRQAFPGAEELST